MNVIRSIWKGAISFGLVNIPINLYPVEEDNDLKFHLIDSRDENKIKYKRVNEVTGEEVPWDNIVKAYEFEDGEYVVMTDEDFVKADVSATRTVDIETFIKREELSLMYLEKPYYIAPTKGGEKAYTLLREALEKTEKIAVARVVIRTKEYLTVVYSLNNALVLNLIRFYDDIRSMDDLKIPESVKVSPKELELAESLIDSLTEEWKPAEYKDKYRDAVMNRIEAKSKKSRDAGEVEEPDEGEDTALTGKVVDIMDLLRRSVEAKKSQAEKKTTTEKAAVKHKSAASAADERPKKKVSKG